MQNTHPGTIALDGDTASGRAYMSELGRTRDGRQGLNYAIYHDRYQRTGDGWKFSERVYAAPTPRSAPPTSGAATAATDSTTAPGSPCASTSRPACSSPEPHARNTWRAATSAEATSNSAICCLGPTIHHVAIYLGQDSATELSTDLNCRVQPEVNNVGAT